MTFSQFFFLESDICVSSTLHDPTTVLVSNFLPHHLGIPVWSYWPAQLYSMDMYGALCGECHDVNVILQSRSLEVTAS